ncbi:Protein Hook-like 1 [Manis pentadactyla]|nr:Protein Hook-like 1 [Manis pentadactyla]
MKKATMGNDVRAKGFSSEGLLQGIKSYTHRSLTQVKASQESKLWRLPQSHTNSSGTFQDVIKRSNARQGNLWSSKVEGKRTRSLARPSGPQKAHVIAWRVEARRLPLTKAAEATVTLSSLPTGPCQELCIFRVETHSERETTHLA